MPQKLSTETEHFCSFFLLHPGLGLFFSFTALYNISLMTHGLSDIFPNKTATVEADLIMNWTSLVRNATCVGSESEIVCIGLDYDTSDNIPQIQTLVRKLYEKGWLYS